MDLPVNTEAADGAVLRLQVNDNTVATADLVDPLNEKSRVAALQPAVVVAIDALVGSSIAALGPDLVVSVNELRTAYEGHRVEKVILGPGVHMIEDAVNTVSLSLVTSQQGAIELLNDIRAQLTAHMRTSSNSSSPWHFNLADDLDNLPLAAQANSLATATVLASDLRFRVHERHRVQDDDTTGGPPVHDEEDTVNVIPTSATPLELAIVEFLDALAAVDPVAPPNESEGAQDAAHRYGFELSA